MTKPRFGAPSVYSTTAKPLRMINDLVLDTNCWRSEETVRGRSPGHPRFHYFPRIFLEIRLDCKNFKGQTKADELGTRGPRTTGLD